MKGIYSRELRWITCVNCHREIRITHRATVCPICDKPFDKKISKDMPLKSKRIVKDKNGKLKIVYK